MKTTLRALLIFIVSITISLWICLQTAQGQAWCKKIICDTVKEKSGYEVSLGKIQGIPPFFLHVKDIELFETDTSSQIPWEKKLVHVGSLYIVPNWFTVCFGNLSFFYIGLQDLVVEEFEDKEREANESLFPPVSIDIWSFAATHVLLPEKYAKPFLNSLYNDVDVKLLYDIRGKLHYKADDKSVKATLKIAPTIGDTAPFLFEARVKHDPHESIATLQVDAQNPPSGSAFIQLPVDTLNGRFDLDLIQMKGTWQLAAMLRKEKKTILPECIRIAVHGTADIPSLSRISFVTTQMNCQEFHTESFDQDDTPIPLYQVRTIPMDGTLKAMLSCADKIAITIESDALSLLGQRVSPFQVQLTLEPEKFGFRGDLALKAELESQKGKLPLTATFAWASDMKSKAKVNDLLLTFANMKAKGNLDVSFYPLQLRGALQSNRADCGPSSPFLESMQMQKPLLTAPSRLMSYLKKQKPILHSIALQAKAALSKKQLQLFLQKILIMISSLVCRTSQINR